MQIEVAHFEAVSREQRVLRSRFTKDTTISMGFEAKTTCTKGGKASTKKNTTISTDLEVKKTTTKADMTMIENASISTDVEWKITSSEVGRSTTQDTKTPITETTEVSVIIPTDKNTNAQANPVIVASPVTETELERTTGV